MLTAVTLGPASTAAAPHACLVVLFGAEIGKRVVLAERETTIGRSHSADLQLDLDNVSRSHALITRTSRGFVLRDQNSTNGTFVNEQPIRERALKDGDQIRIGHALIKFLASSNVEAQYHEEIYRLMTLDGLTQVYNRRHFQDSLEREIARSRRYQHPFALVLLDIDHFKQINDRYGHQAGDAVLRRLGGLLNAKVRTNDLLARLGGEEFALILPETQKAGALALAEKLRRVIEIERFAHEGNLIPVTASLGVASFNASIDNSDALLKVADQRLYEAKRGGRNRVC